MKYTFGSLNLKESLVIFEFLRKLRGVTLRRGEVLIVPGNVIDIIPVESFYLTLNARPGNMPGELVITQECRVHSVWTSPSGEGQDVNVDITCKGDNMECGDKKENIDADNRKDLRGSSPPKSTQVGGDHYSKMKIQPIDFITANGIGYIEGNIIKYVCRYKSKNGVEDLKKAQHYLQMLIEQEERDRNE